MIGKNERRSDRKYHNIIEAEGFYVSDRRGKKKTKRDTHLSFPLLGNENSTMD